MDIVTLSSQFQLRKDITYLNFGSFGACPKPIMDDYFKWQLELESEPVQFIAVTGPRLVAESRQALGSYIGCDGNDLVYTTNPTFAINIIAKNLDLMPGDEVLTTDLEYGALDRTWSYYCREKKAVYVRQHIKLPIQSKEELIEQFFSGLSKRTKAIFISHITSATGLILPVHEICSKAKSLGLLTIVDGAHVPGHITLDLLALPADIYTGACHKWMMTPKGCSFLYVKKEFQDSLDPLVISWGYESANPSDSKFIDYHQFNGTRDFSAFLTIPASIRFMQEYKWPEVAAQCRKLVKENGPLLCNILGTEPLAPLTDAFYGQLFSAPVHTTDPEKLQRLLFEQYKIEIPVTRQDSHRYIRFSVNAFNTGEDLKRLFEALKDIIKTTSLIEIR